MMDAAEKALTALLAADAPPARDAAFALAVMARIEKAQFRDELVRNGAIAALAGLALFAFAPQLAGAMQGLGTSLLPVAVVTFAAIWAMQWSLREIEL
jgi:hypothetical protein